MTSAEALQVLIVSGSAGRKSSTGSVLREAEKRLYAMDCQVDFLDLGRNPLPLFNPDLSYQEAYYAPLKSRVEQADVLLLGTPDYHGCISGALKNFLDHFWKEYAGKLIATVVASYEKGLTVTDQLRTFARQSYAWTLPYGVAYMDKTEVKDGQIIHDAFHQRLDMMVRDIKIYGALLAAQRRADLAGQETCFMARYRSA